MKPCSGIFFVFGAHLLLYVAEAFFITSSIPAIDITRSRAISLSMSKNEENTRRVMDEKNSVLSLDDELRYGVTIGDGTVNQEGALQSTSKLQEPSSSQTNQLMTDHPNPSRIQAAARNKLIERMTRPRAYPLFLLEKLAILAEDTVSFLTSSLSESRTDDFYVTSGYQIEKRPKERIIVLGTGWGAAAFLKDIDTDMYDVTVISPRNFFLFTPMLAGASVGTVEFRSITESIRQVRRWLQHLR